MNCREAADRNGVLPFYLKFLIAVLKKTSAQQTSVDMEILPAEAALDRDFPGRVQTSSASSSAIISSITFRPIAQKPGSVASRPNGVSNSL